MNSRLDISNLDPIAYRKDKDDTTDEEDWATQGPAMNACSTHGTGCDCGVGSSSSLVSQTGDPSAEVQKYRAPYSISVSDMILLRAIQEFEPLTAITRGDKGRRWMQVANACREREQDMLGSDAGLHWAGATAESVRKRWIRLTQRLDGSTRRLDNSTGSTEDLSEVEKLVKEILVTPEAQALNKALQKKKADDQRIANYLGGKRLAAESMRTDPRGRRLNRVSRSSVDLSEEGGFARATSPSSVSSVSARSLSPLRSPASRGFTSLSNLNEVTSILMERLNGYNEEKVNATEHFNATIGQLRDSIQDMATVQKETMQQLMDAQKVWMKQLMEMNLALANIISSNKQQ
ncbi:hypothetical protein BGW39_002973 [Mortierella sp. 14UC]|nr:hypothetical protein BGW39_002973 [Mortierella sp. 14UC]